MFFFLVSSANLSIHSKFIVWNEDHWYQIVLNRHDQLSSAQLAKPHRIASTMSRWTMPDDEPNVSSQKIRSSMFEVHACQKVQLVQPSMNSTKRLIASAYIFSFFSLSIQITVDRNRIRRVHTHTSIYKHTRVWKTRISTTDYRGFRIWEHSHWNETSSRRQQQQLENKVLLQNLWTIEPGAQSLSFSLAVRIEITSDTFHPFQISRPTHEYSSCETFATPPVY